jgi:hypothetical protein
MRGLLKSASAFQSLFALLSLSILRLSVSIVENLSVSIVENLSVSIVENSIKGINTKLPAIPPKIHIRVKNGHRSVTVPQI